MKIHLFCGTLFQRINNIHLGNTFRGDNLDFLFSPIKPGVSPPDVVCAVLRLDGVGLSVPLLYLKKKTFILYILNSFCNLQCLTYLLLEVE